jgi:hypothetical protein
MINILKMYYFRVPPSHRGSHTLSLKHCSVYYSRLHTNYGHKNKVTYRSAKTAEALTHQTTGEK